MNDFSFTFGVGLEASCNGSVTSNAARFRLEYNQTSFLFSHRLGETPLLTLPALTALALRLAPRGGVYCSNGAVAVTDRWEAGTASGRTLEDTLRHINENHSLVMLRFGVQDERTGPLLRDTLWELIELVGPALRDDAAYARATILIASPGRITSYHIDSDTNFLFQVAGRKRFSVFGAGGPPLLKADEVERYFAGDNNAARFPADRAAEAVAYDIGPGDGVHVPPLMPHWARNGDEVSVAVSFNFDLRSIDRLRRLHKVNARLRRLGLRPPVPDPRRLRDRAKLALSRLPGPGGGLATAGDGWVPSERPA